MHTQEAARIVGELGNGAPVVMVKGHGLFEVVPLRSLLDGKAVSFPESREREQETDRQTDRQTDT